MLGSLLGHLVFYFENSFPNHTIENLHPDAPTHTKSPLTMFHQILPNAKGVCVSVFMLGSPLGHLEFFFQNNFPNHTIENLHPDAHTCIKSPLTLFRQFYQMQKGCVSVCVLC